MCSGRPLCQISAAHVRSPCAKTVCPWVWNRFQQHLRVVQRVKNGSLAWIVDDGKWILGAWPPGQILVARQ